MVERLDGLISVPQEWHKKKVRVFLPPLIEQGRKKCNHFQIAMIQNPNYQIPNFQISNFQIPNFQITNFQIPKFQFPFFTF